MSKIRHKYQIILNPLQFNRFKEGKGLTITSEPTGKSNFKDGDTVKLIEQRCNTIKKYNGPNELMSMSFTGRCIIGTVSRIVKYHNDGAPRVSVYLDKHKWKMEVNDKFIDVNGFCYDIKREKKKWYIHGIYYNNNTYYHKSGNDKLRIFQSREEAIDNCAIIANLVLGGVNLLQENSSKHSKKEEGEYVKIYHSLLERFNSADFLM